MSHQGGWDQQGDGGRTETTRVARPPAGGWDDWDPHGQGGPPRSTKGRGAAFAVIGLLVAVVLVGLLALAGYLYLGRDSAGGTDPVAAGVEPGSAGVQPRSAGVQPESAGVEPGSAGVEPGSAGASAPVWEAPDQADDPATATEPARGTYTGLLSQRGTSGGRSDRDYPVEMTFSAGGSTVDYPTLRCSGTLTPTGDSGGARVYRETITEGRCDPSGTWYVTRGSDSAVAAEYRPETGPYVVTGQLTR